MFLVGFLVALAAGTCWGLYILVGAALVPVSFGVADSGTALIQPRVLVSGLAVVLLSLVILYHEEQYSVRLAGRHDEAAEPPCGAPHGGAELLLPQP